MVNDSLRNDEAPARGVRPNPLELGTDAVLRHALLVVLVTVLGTLLGFFVALVKPNEYQSVGKLLVRPGPRDAISAESTIVGFGDLRGAGPRDLVATELQMLVGESLYSKAAAHIGVDKVLQPYDPRSADGEQTPWSTRLMHQLQAWWFAADGAADSGGDASAARLAARFLEFGVRLYPETGTNVITVAYSTHDPKLAQEVVDGFLKAAIDVHREAYAASASLETVEREKKTVEDAAREAEKLLREFKVKHVIYDAASQRSALIASLGTLEQQIAVAAVEIGAKQAERDKLVQLRDTDVGKEPGSVTAMLNTEYSGLLQHIRQLQMARVQLEGQRNTLPKEEMERLLALNTALETEARMQLAKEKPTIELMTQDVGDTRRRRLQTAIEQAEVALQGLQKQLDLRVADRDKLRQRIGEAMDLQPQLEALEYDARSKRQEADRLAAGLDNLKSIQRLDQLNLSNLQVLHPAAFVPEKVGPTRSKWLVTGTLLGFLCGAGLALLLRLRDPRIRGGLDLRWQGVRLHGEVVAGTDAAPAQPGPAALAGTARDEIARLWARLPFDRRTEGLTLAFVADDGDPRLSRVAGVFAVGLALHGGERVAYVGCRGAGSWLERQLGVRAPRRLEEHLAGACDLAAATGATPIAGLSILAVGDVAAGTAHPMQSSGFATVLQQLATTHDFVVVDLPAFEQHPEGRAVLRVVDGVLVAARAGRSTKAGVRDILDSAQAAGAAVVGGVLVRSR